VDRGLAKRLQREAAVAARAEAWARKRHASAVARRDRALRRAQRAVPLHTAGAGAGAVLFALDGAHDVVWGGLTGFCALVVVRAVTTLRYPPPVPEQPAAVPAPPPPPPRASSAWPLVVRLEAVRADLGRLVPLVGPAGRAAATEAWQAAAEADAALRWQAARLAAVEPHRGTDPELLRSLSDGVGCQERLVQAMADLVAASDPHLPGASLRLQDATDALHGLADGLRQVR
jgi:hypothetical protein